MATVYRGFDVRLDVERAIKVLSPEMSARPSIRQRFEVEARTMAKLQHPNIVSVQDVGVEGDRVYMVMELVEGGSLMDRLDAGGPLSPVAACHAVEAILAALSVAHARGVVHRDIKPHNVLVTSAGVCKVTDFGIARVAEGDHPDTRTGTAMGTWAYMAPEQRSSAKHVDGRADLYAVAATFYVLLTLREPYDLYAVEQHDEIFDGLPAQIVGVLKRAIRFKPEDRYPTAPEMLEAVRQARYALEPGAPLGEKPARVESAEAIGGGLHGFGEALGVVSHTAVPARRITSETFAAIADEPTADEPRSGPAVAASTSVPQDLSIFTEPPVPSRRWPMIAGVVGAAVLGMFAVFSAGIWLFAPTDGGVPAVIGADAGGGTPTHAEQPLPGPSPLQPAVATTGTPVDIAAGAPAAVPAVPKPSAASKPPAAKPVVSAAPSLPTAPAFINSQPWAHVTVDGKTVGDTFWKGALSVGAHRVVLVTEDGRRKEMSLSVAEGDPNRLCWDFTAEATCSR